jgi:archaellum biogenesis protein FlaJ (TadC family)
MPRGGKRKGAGRKKVERPVDGNIARKIKAQINAEEKWLLIIKIATEKAKKTGNTSDLRHALEYLDDRDLGRPVDTVNHLHDKPIEMNVHLDLAERIAKARRKLQ